MDDHESARTKKLEGTIIVVHLQLVDSVATYGSGRLKITFHCKSIENNRSKIFEG